MKRMTRNNLLQVTILAVSSLFVVLTLIQTELPGSGQRQEPLEISVLIRESDNTLWANIRLGMEQAAQDYNADLRFLTPSTTNDPDEQLTLLQREVLQGADGLIVSAADPAALHRALEQEESPPPLLYLDSAPENALLLAPDNPGIGAALAQAMLEDGVAGRILLLDTSDQRAGIAQRMEGCRQALAAAGYASEVLYIEASSIPAVLPSLVMDEQIGAVFAFEPLATLKAAQALDGIRRCLPLYGVGGSGALAAYLEKGSITALAAWNEYTGGYLALQYIIGAAQGAELQQPAALQFSVIRGDTMYEPEYQKLLFPFTR